MIALPSVALLALLAATPALVCPEGTARRGAAPPEGFEEWCEGEDAYGRPRRHGPARTYYDDGALWIEERWEAGQRHGPFLELHRSGAKAREGTFARGERIGRWVVYWASGRLEEESEWRRGAMHGRFAAYWSTGAARTVGRYCGGAQCGTWRTFDDAGHELGAVDYAVPLLDP